MSWKRRNAVLRRRASQSSPSVRQVRTGQEDRSGLRLMRWRWAVASGSAGGSSGGEEHSEHSAAAGQEPLKVGLASCQRKRGRMEWGMVSAIRRVASVVVGLSQRDVSVFLASI